MNVLKLIQLGRIMTDNKKINYCHKNKRSGTNVECYNGNYHMLRSTYWSGVTCPICLSKKPCKGAIK